MSVSLRMRQTLACLVTACWLCSPAGAQERDATGAASEHDDEQAELDLEPTETEAADPSERAATAESTAANSGDSSAFGDEPGADAETVAKARAHFEQGVEYYTEGDFRAALIELQRAYSLHRTYKLLYNLGQVADELRDYAGAERYFRDYLAKGGSELAPERRREVQQELARLRGRVSTLRIRSNPPGARLRVDDREILHPDGAVRVSAGRRRVRADKPGYAPVERSVDVTGGEELDVELKFAAPLVAAAPGGQPARASSSRWPWVTGIMAGTFGIAAGAVGFAAYKDVSARDEALTHYTPREQLDDMAKQAHTKAVIADSLLGAALVSAVVTTVLVLVDDGKPEQRTPATASQVAGLHVQF